MADKDDERDDKEEDFADDEIEDKDLADEDEEATEDDDLDSQSAAEGYKSSRCSHVHWCYTRVASFDRPHLQTRSIALVLRAARE